MDEELLTIKKGDNIPIDDRVYRLVLSTDRDKRNQCIPSIRCFSLSPADNGSLSVDWERMTTPEECLARCGASYRKGKEEYKQYGNRELYALDVSFLCSLDDVEKVVYDPIYFDEHLKGRVNNPAHSLVKFNEMNYRNNPNDPETILKMRNHAAERKIVVDIEKVHKLVEELRFF